MSKKPEGWSENFWLGYSQAWLDYVTREFLYRKHLDRKESSTMYAVLSAGFVNVEHLLTEDVRIKIDAMLDSWVSTSPDAGPGKAGAGRESF